LNTTPTTSSSSATYYKPQTSTSAAYSGTYAAPPVGSSFSSTSVSVPYEPEVVTPSADYTLFLDLKKRASTVKTLAAIDFVRQSK
jgi:hypothetical protein